MDWLDSCREALTGLLCGELAAKDEVPLRSTAGQARTCDIDWLIEDTARSGLLSEGSGTVILVADTRGVILLVNDPGNQNFTVCYLEKIAHCVHTDSGCSHLIGIVHVGGRRLHLLLAYSNLPFVLLRGGLPNILFSFAISGHHKFTMIP